MDINKNWYNLFKLIVHKTLQFLELNILRFKAELLKSLRELIKNKIFIFEMQCFQLTLAQKLFVILLRRKYVT